MQTLAALESKIMECFIDNCKEKISEESERETPIHGSPGYGFFIEFGHCEVIKQ